MADVKAVADWMAERGISPAQLVELSGLDRRVVEAITRGQYTPSPEQRQRVSRVLGVEVGQVARGHRVGIAHVYGHGPQFGRSP